MTLGPAVRHDPRMSSAVVGLHRDRIDSRTLVAIGWLCLAEAVIAGIAVICLVVMYGLFAVGETVQGQWFGGVNDWLGLVTSVLAIPIVIVVGRVLYERRSPVSLLLTIVAIGAFCAIVVLSWLLVSGTWSFEQQIGPISAAYVVLMGWFVVTGRRMVTTGFHRHGLALGIGAALYVGFPVWAFAVGRRLIRMGRLDQQS